MPVGRAELLAWLSALEQVYVENQQWLTDLDSAIGDADHGFNMARGFTAVKAELAKHGSADLRTILQSTAMVLIRTVGGASGPLYGTFFLRAAAFCGDREELSPPEVVSLFDAGVEGVRQRGKAEPGDKTMLDALLPAVDAMRAGLNGSAALPRILDQGAAAAEAGMRATIPMQARKGRASYLGPRSAGHQDPGATSAWLLIRTAALEWSRTG